MTNLYASLFNSMYTGLYTSTLICIRYVYNLYTCMQIRIHFVKWKILYNFPLLLPSPIDALEIN